MIRATMASLLVGGAFVACSGYEGGGDVRIVPLSASDASTSSDASVEAGRDGSTPPRDGSIDSAGPGASGVLGYWPLDGSGNDGSSSSTARHDLQLLSGSFSNGQVGSAIVMTNQGFAARLAQTYPALDFADRDFTVQAWIATGGVAAGIGTSPFSGGSTAGWVLYASTSNVVFRTTDPRGPLTASIPTSTGMRHVVARRANGTLTLFVDGNAVASRDDVPTIGPGSAFGIEQSGTTSGLQGGRVDEIVIWSRALSEPEILSLHARGQAGQPFDPGG